MAAALLALCACGPAGAGGAGAAEIEVVVTAPGGSAPGGGLVAFLPDDTDAVQGYWEDALDARGHGVLRPRAGVAGTVFVFAQDLTAWRSKSTVATAGRVRIDAPLSAGLSVEGVVVGRDGVTPVPAARIRVTERAFRDVRAGLGVRTVTTDAAGRFRAAGLAPGPVRLDALGSEARPELGERAVDEVDAGTRDVRLVLSRTIRVQLLPVDAATGGGLSTARLEIEELFPDGEEVGRMFDAWRRTDASPEPVPVPRAPLWVSGHDVARFRIRAAGYEPSEIVEVDPNRGPAAQAIRVELTPDPGSIATLRLRVETADGDVPDWLYVALRSRVGHRERGRRLRTSGAAVDVALPPGPASLRVEGQFPGGGAGVPWLPVEVDADLARGAVVERRVVLPAGGFLRMAGEPEHANLPSEAHRAGASAGEDPLVVIWDRDRDAGTSTSLAIPAGDYEMRWWQDDGTCRTVAFTIRAREVTEIRRPAQ